MSPDPNLLARIKGEFLEMPGLRLTFDQACRLWQVDPPVCRAALDALAEIRAVYHTPDGYYISWPTAPRTLKSRLRGDEPVHSDALRSAS